MRAIYEAVVDMIDRLEVSDKTDALLQRLGTEMDCPSLGTPALLEAADLLIDNLRADPRPLARYRRLHETLNAMDGLLAEQETRLMGLLAREMMRPQQN